MAETRGTKRPSRQAPRHGAHSQEGARAAASRGAKRREARAGVPALLCALLVALGVLGGVALDRFVLGTGAGGTLTGKLTLSEAELDDIVATYTYKGKRHELTAREVFEHEGQLSSAQRADGSYEAPTADAVLACVRGQVVAAEAERLGIAVGDEDVLAYAEATLGTRDLTSVAAVYGQSVEAVRAQLAEAALMARLRAQVVVESYPEAPAMPEQPGVGEEVTLLPGYASYVIGLAGGEWNAETDTWASVDGVYARALADYEVSSSGASYEAALVAYWVAYQAYVGEHAEASAVWTDYVNGLLAETTLALSSVVV